jgi:hypothetical protein
VPFVNLNHVAKREFRIYATVDSGTTSIFPESS